MDLKELAYAFAPGGAMAYNPTFNPIAAKKTAAYGAATPVQPKYGGYGAAPAVVPDYAAAKSEAGPAWGAAAPVKPNYVQPNKKKIFDPLAAAGAPARPGAIRYL